MVRRVSTHVRHNVVAYLALFFAFGGTAYAAATIGSEQIVDNSVQSRDVRDDSSSGGGLGSADLKGGSVGGSEVANDSLKGADIDENSLNVTRVIARPQGSSSVAAGSSATNYPLTNAAFTQAGNQSLSITGELAYDNSTCQSTVSNPQSTQPQLTLKLDGKPLSTFFQEDPASATSSGEAAKGVVFVSTTPELLETGVSRSRTLTAEVSELCAAGGITVKSMKLMVLGIR